jgi:predicted nucleic acid-binding protein
MDTTIPIIDSNVLLDIFMESQDKDKAVRIIKKNGCFINELVLCEVLNFIQNKWSYYHSCKIQQYIFDRPETFQFLSHTKDNFKHASKIRQQYNDCEFSFTDCVILAQSITHNLSVVTRDTRMFSCKEAVVETL